MDPEFVRDNSRSIARSVLKWGRAHFQDYPWRHTSSPWLGLIAEIMLARTRASTVVPVWTEFSSRYPTPEDFLNAPVGEPENLIESLGLRWRAPLVRSLAENLAGNDVPRDPHELEKLPGVGRYVAAAYASFHGNRRAVIIDANVVRLIARMNGREYGPETRRERWLNDLADDMTPVRAFRDYNYGILDLSMTVCVRNPACHECPVIKFCSYGARSSVENEDHDPAEPGIR